MGYCSVLGCKNRSTRKDPGISFHSLPVDLTMKKKWIHATGRKNWYPKKYAKICSIHFEISSFIVFGKTTHLIPTAVPNKYIYNEGSSENSSMSRVERFTTKTQDTWAIKNIRTRTERKSDDNQNISPTKKQCLFRNVQNPAPHTNRVLVEVQNMTTIQSIENATNPTSSRQPQKTVQEIKTKLHQQKQVSANRLRKLRAVRASKRRLAKKVAVLENVLTDLKCKLLINTEESEVLVNIEKENKDFLKRYLLKENSSRQYSSALRKFALCLNFISPKAYLYVRKSFNTCLPHPKTLYNWYKTINCEPGFTQESLEAIKTLVNKSKHKIIVALSMDEMSIRQHLQWDGQKTVGYVNVGDNLDTDSLQMAKDALVFMVTAVNGSWKLPIGYFLIHGINGEQRSNLVKSCVNLLAECGIVVASLTFDGCPSNFAMAKILGAKFDDINNINTTIKIADQEIVIFPDPCHMIKLARNTLGDKKILLNSDGKIITWELIKKLHELQEVEGLHFANKLRKSHIMFRKQIMKVRLATQTFSKSVAEALLFCEQLGIEGFENAYPTAEFVKYFNDIFDILNSRKLFSYGYKKPITKENFMNVQEKLNCFEEYLKGLKIDGESLLKSGRKTGFLGLICCIHSVRLLFKNLINVHNAPLKYLCTYKMSQDHLEIFFGSIRSKGGFNNNPTVLQFISAYRRLLIHGELKNLNDSGNCIALDDLNILNINKEDYVNKINDTSHKLSRDISSENSNEDLPVDVPFNHDYLENSQLTEFSQEVTAYIAGFIVKKLKKQLKCDDCILALLSSERMCRFIAHKDFFGLNYPSQDVIDVCLYTERVVRMILSGHGPNYFVNKNNMPRVIFKIFKYFVNRNVFASLEKHINDQDPFNNHISLLIKSIAMRYIEVRIHHVLKSISTSNTRIRNKYMKLILFKGQ